MIEVQPCAEALAPSDRSLVVLDGVGRGTNNFGGRAPKDRLARAKQLLFDIEEDAEHLGPKIAGPGPEAAGGVQPLGLFAARPSAVERELAGLELDGLTPIEALLELRELQGRL